MDSLGGSEPPLTHQRVDSSQESSQEAELVIQAERRGGSEPGEDSGSGEGRRL